jgi:hypothetical protein
VVAEWQANMPMKSKDQMAAMYAAAAGKSTIGIPKKVGKEFVKSGKAKPNLPQKVMKRAAGRGR